MFDQWTIGAFIRFSSNASMVMGGIASSTRTANAELSAQNKLLLANAERQKQLRALSMVAGGVALGLGVGIVTGIQQAAALQQNMVGVGIATKTTGAAMQEFFQMAVQMSGVTAQSVATISAEMAAAATSGINTRAQLLNAFPEMAKAADVMWLSPKHIDPVDSIRQMATLAHLFGSYGGPPGSQAQARFEKMITRATQMMFVQPEALQRVITQGRLFMPLALSAGVSEQDIFEQSMMMGQTGNLRSRGGSGFRMILQRLLGAGGGTGASDLTAKQASAMHMLGVTDSKGHLIYEDKTGHILLQKAVDHLYTVQKNFTPVAFTRELLQAFGAQGGSLLAAELRPAAFAKSQQNWNQLISLGSIDSMWTRYSNTFNFAWAQFTTNFKNTVGAVFLPLLPAFTKALKSTATELGVWTQYLLKHPIIASRIGVGMMVAFGAAVGVSISAAAAAARTVGALNVQLGILGWGGGGGGGPRGGGGIGGAIERDIPKMGFWGKAGLAGEGALNFLTFGGYGAGKWLLQKATSAGIPGAIGDTFSGVFKTALNMTGISKLSSLLGPSVERMGGAIMTKLSPALSLARLQMDQYTESVLKLVRPSVLAAAITGMDDFSARVGIFASRLASILPGIDILALFLQSTGSVNTNEDQWLRTHPLGKWVHGGGGGHTVIEHRHTVEVKGGGKIRVSDLKAAAPQITAMITEHIMKTAQSESSRTGSNVPTHPFFAPSAIAAYG